VKNHDFTPKNHIFTNFRGARRVWAGCHEFATRLCWLPWIYIHGPPSITKYLCHKWPRICFLSSVMTLYLE
jgi:hypothetical protein